MVSMNSRSPLPISYGGSTIEARIEAEEAFIYLFFISETLAFRSFVF